MRRGVVAWIALGMLVVVLGVPGVASYNRLVRTQSQVRREWGTVDNLLSVRSALVEPALRTLEELSGTEPDLLAAVATAGDLLDTAATREERITAARDLDTTLSQLIVAVESDSTWNVDASVRRFRAELAGIERQLSIERTSYNETVLRFNGMLQRFPTNLFANMLGFSHSPLYRESPTAAEIPPAERRRTSPGTDG